MKWKAIQVGYAYLQKNSKEDEVMDLLHCLGQYLGPPTKEKLLCPQLVQALQESETKESE